MTSDTASTAIQRCLQAASSYAEIAGPIPSDASSDEELLYHCKYSQLALHARIEYVLAGGDPTNAIRLLEEIWNELEEVYDLVPDFDEEDTSDEQLEIERKFQIDFVRLANILEYYDEGLNSTTILYRLTDELVSRIEDDEERDAAAKAAQTEIITLLTEPATLPTVHQAPAPQAPVAAAPMQEQEMEVLQPTNFLGAAKLPHDCTQLPHECAATMRKRLEEITEAMEKSTDPRKLATVLLIRRETATVLEQEIISETGSLVAAAPKRRLPLGHHNTAMGNTYLKLVGLTRGQEQIVCAEMAVKCFNVARDYNIAAHGESHKTPFFLGAKRGEAAFYLAEALAATNAGIKQVRAAYETAIDYLSTAVQAHSLLDRVSKKQKLISGAFETSRILLEDARSAYRLTTH